MTLSVADPEEAAEAKRLGLAAGVALKDPLAGHSPTSRTWAAGSGWAAGWAPRRVPRGGAADLRDAINARAAPDAPKS